MGIDAESLFKISESFCFLALGRRARSQDHYGPPISCPGDVNIVVHDPGISHEDGNKSRKRGQEWEEESREKRTCHPTTVSTATTGSKFRQR